MNWRRARGKGAEEPEQVLQEARAAVTGLRQVLADLRTHLEELEAEVRQPNTEEV